MGSDPAFLFYPGDYLRDTQCLSEPVQVAYDRIMCEHMRNICISQDQLNFFTKRFTSEQKSELKQVLKKVTDGFQIEWVAESIEKRRNYSDSRRKNREGKSTKPKIISKSYVPHMENEIENVFSIQLAKILNKKYEAGADRGINGIGQDVDSLIIQMKNVGMDNVQIMSQATAMKAYYELKDWPMPTNYIKLLTALTENDWPQKLKDEDPDKKAERINKSLKDASRKQPEPDTIGTSAPGSLN